MMNSAVAVVKTLSAFDIKAKIKWPNDIIVNGKKICGILIENVFEGENVLVRRGKDDRRYRSSLYTATALVFINDGIYASQKTFSLIEDSEIESDAEFFYDELENAFVSEEEATLADGAKAKTCFVVFTCGGKEIFRAPAKSSYALTALCDDINHEIAEIKRKNAK
jgi:phosphotransferase system HPr-like phosphotransfer protein